MTKILIVTDAWRPQINGVVRTLERLSEEIRRFGIEVDLLTPAEFPTLPCPTYPEIRLALTGINRVRRRIEAARPDYVHIATEGPLGLMTAKVVNGHGPGFTTSYHTRFPEYLSARLPVPQSWSYAWLKRFHNRGLACMVATESLRRDLSDRGFNNLAIWSRGVDQSLFRPRTERILDLPRPIFMNVGRVSVEKNIEAFLDLDLPGSKVIVGDGPVLGSLKKRYPDVHFLGTHTGEDLARLYAAADVFVFPSLTDTFGNVLIEALACGVPVAAYPVMGPVDVIGDTGSGVLSNDLQEACLAALDIPREAALARAADFTWERATQQFVDTIEQAQRRRRTVQAA
ncbi:glycosyltransferase family 4 protein [Prosthecomicrobium hirschii]|uniref:Alpha-mannosyltransferase n=1 Tax=Prosthecodimorpha hirschii TaxID=665126 RepID=A0A0P6WEA1_9HYPH|nr:glycosyltransferase family 1 protein [Prosthecomicrobium hirschii]KPL54789.1 alpha-mannosyltransferase [Prosthecomicrobium hirschii]MCW1840327.1 glycosyltransferase family 1 protein [Prosthecomicrobium hirschii]TPQ49522.1 glycosyltransferase family 1 protein [Prosthecomicrobium hirschii]